MPKSRAAKAVSGFKMGKESQPTFLDLRRIPLPSVKQETALREQHPTSRIGLVIPRDFCHDARPEASSKLLVARGSCRMEAG